MDSKWVLSSSVDPFLLLNSSIEMESIFICSQIGRVYFEHWFRKRIEKEIYPGKRATECTISNDIKDVIITMTMWCALITCCSFSLFLFLFHFFGWFSFILPFPILFFPLTLKEPGITIAQLLKRFKQITLLLGESCEQWTLPFYIDFFSDYFLYNRN